MTTSAWKWLLLALCVVFLAQEAATIWTTTTYVANAGIGPRDSVAPFHWRVNVDPGTAAQRAGVQTGDVVDARKLSSAERFRFWSQLVAEVPVGLPVVRDGRTRVVTFTPGRSTIHWGLWLAIAAGFWTGICAIVLVLRRPESLEVRLLVMWVLLMRLSIQMSPGGNWATPWVRADLVNVLVADLMLLGWPLIAVYAGTLLPRASSAVRVLTITSCAFAVVATVLPILALYGVWSAALDPESAMFTGPFDFFVQFVYLFAPICTSFIVLTKLRGTDRERLAWVLGPAVVYFLVLFYFSFYNQLWFVPNSVVDTTSLVVQLAAPVGLTYAMLNRRLLDIGFALNRAAVYAGVSVVIVGIFVLVEWAFSEWFTSATHAENLLVSAALALVLGLSVRAIHRRVDLLLDTIFFRKRHEDEEAIRVFAHEAPFITDAGILLHRTAAILERHADATGVRILLDNGAGSYSGVDENDAAIVSLRASQRLLDLHGIDTAIGGEFVYPMVARGRLLGVLALGPKRSGESYAPDESAAIATLARDVAGVLDVLSTKTDSTKDAILDGIRSLQATLSDIAAALHARA